MSSSRRKKKKSEPISVRIFLIIFGVFLGFVLIEIIISLLDPALTSLDEKKEFIQDAGKYANCYPDNPRGKFHLDLHDKDVSERFRFEFGLSDERLSALKENTPFCIVYGNRSFISDRASGKIAIVGDSFAFGEGVNDNETLGWYIYDGLDEKASVANFGVSGADVGYVKDILFPRALNSSGVDTIIYFYNLNDVPIMTAQKIGDSDANLIDLQNIRFYNIISDKNKFISKILTATGIGRLILKTIYLRLKTSETINDYLSFYSKRNQNGMNFLFSALHNMDVSSKDKNVKFVLVIYPLIYKDPFGNYPFLRIHKALMDFCNENAITCIDGYDAFRDYSSLDGFRVHEIDYHPNEKANELIAGLVIDEYDKS